MSKQCRPRSDAPQNVASDQGLHYLQLIFRLQRVVKWISSPGTYLLVLGITTFCKWTSSLRFYLSVLGIITFCKMD